jgi:hypothetical protein
VATAAVTTAASLAEANATLFRQVEHDGAATSHA